MRGGSTLLHCTVNLTFSPTFSLASVSPSETYLCTQWVEAKLTLQNGHADVTGLIYLDRHAGIFKGVYSSCEDSETERTQEF